MSAPFEMPSRVTFARVKALEIDAEQIIALFQVGDGRAVAFRGMPADARAVGMRGMSKFGKVVLLVESAEFPTVDVSEGAALPSLDIEATTVAFRAPEPEAASDLPVRGAADFPPCLCGAAEALARGEKYFGRIDIVCPRCDL